MAAPFTHVSNVGKLVFECSSFKNEKSRHKKVVREHFFNYAVGVLIPGCNRLPDIVDQLSEERAFIVRLPVHSLIEKEFIEAFVKTGDVYLLSHGTQIDTEDCVALLPTGQLILHVTKDAYEQLGLEGKPSMWGGKKPGKYVITIDLTKPYFTPGKKNYERVRNCLKKNFPMTLNFLGAWRPYNPKICPSSLPWYFERLGYSCRDLSMKQTLKTHRGIKVPVIDSREVEPTLERCGFSDVYEWLGFVSVNCNMKGMSDEYRSTYSCPEPSIPQSCASYRLEGLITTETILIVLENLREYVKSHSAPWGAVTVHGFADTPVSWQQREHGYQNSGENLYTFLVFPNDDYWLFSAVDSNDICP